MPSMLGNPGVRMNTMGGASGSIQYANLDWTVQEQLFLPDLAEQAMAAFGAWMELDLQRKDFALKDAEKNYNDALEEKMSQLAFDSDPDIFRNDLGKADHILQPGLHIPDVHPPDQSDQFIIDRPEFDEEEGPRVSMGAMEDVPWSIDDQYTYTGDYEGPAKGKPYRDTNNKLTVGRGHNLDAGDSDKSWKRALPNVDRAAVISGQRELTEEEMRKLYAVDMEIHIDKTKKKFPDLDTYPPHIKTMIIDGVYQGFFGYKKDGSPDNTTQAIQRGDWCAAAKHSLSGGSPRGTRTDYHDHVINMEEGMKAYPGRNKDNYYTTVKRYDERKRLLEEMCANSKKGDN